MAVRATAALLAVLVAGYATGCSDEPKDAPDDAPLDDSGNAEASGDAPDDAEACPPLDVPVCTPPDPALTLPDCPLPGGTIGNTEVPDAEPDVGNGSLPGDDTGAPATLPDSVALRTCSETFNRRYEFALESGTIWFRSHAEVTGIEQPWKRLAIPPCLDGTITGIGADDDELIAIRKDGAIYGMDNVLKAPSLFTWSSRWGAPLWRGDGFQLPADMLAWTWSVISPQEDVSWTDPAGNHPAVGGGKVSHIWALRSGGQRFTFFDPWLPKDDSYEMCGPDRGRVRALGLAASGSLIAVIDAAGGIYSRPYDFDLAGDDSLFFKYSYDDQKGALLPAIQLPTFDWVKQPAVPGPITTTLSVHKVGQRMDHRILRVEGQDDAGATGYWEKDVGALGADGWHFVPTDRTLSGPLLRAGACPAATGPDEDILYARGMDRLDEIDGHPGVAGADDWAGELLDFNAYCSPATLRIHFGPDDSFDLRLHTTDKIRQVVRARGLDAQARDFDGAIEIPEKIFAALAKQSKKVRDFVALYLDGKRFTLVKVHAVTGAVTLDAPLASSFEAP